MKMVRFGASYFINSKCWSKNKYESNYFKYKFSSKSWTNKIRWSEMLSNSWSAIDKSECSVLGKLK